MLKISKVKTTQINLNFNLLIVVVGFEVTDFLSITGRKHRSGAHPLGRLCRVRCRIPYPLPKSTPSKTKTEGQVRCSALLGLRFHKYEKRLSSIFYLTPHYYCRFFVVQVHIPLGLPYTVLPIEKRDPLGST